MSKFDPSILTEEDRALAESILGQSSRLYRPDLVIAPDRTPYLYRWWVIPRNEKANVYLHVQVADDPERPLHTHPWENTSVILSGGYDEMLQEAPPRGEVVYRTRRPGDVVHRSAFAAHRLFLTPGIPYTMTLFSTGPVEEEWGFWLDDKFVRHTELIEDLPDGRSVWKGLPKSEME